MILVHFNFELIIPIFFLRIRFKIVLLFEMFSKSTFFKSDGRIVSEYNRELKIEVITLTAKQVNNSL